MTRKKTIPCDRCGARIDHIPEKCPECGEIIRDRMEPHLLQKIENIMKHRSPLTMIMTVLSLDFVCIIWFVSSEELFSIAMFAITAILQAVLSTIFFIIMQVKRKSYPVWPRIIMLFHAVPIITYAVMIIIAISTDGLTV